MDRTEGWIAAFLGVALGFVIALGIASSGAFWRWGPEASQSVEAVKICRERIQYFEKMEAEAVAKMKESIKEDK